MVNILKISGVFLIFCFFALPGGQVRAVNIAEVLAGGFAVEHPKAAGEGEPFALKVKGELTVEDLEVAWLDKTVPLAGQGREAVVVLGVPLACEEKILPLLIRSAREGYRVYSATIEVRAKKFPVQSLKVDPRFVVPPESEVPRIQREIAKNRAIYASVTPERYFSLPLKRPLPGIITSEFGVRRVFNGEPRNRHRGVDFRGAEGTDIYSLAEGRVVLTEDQYYSGNLVIIDHGLGVYSNYAHLSSVRVKEGEMVKAGQLVGLVGMTGRATGPHLHLGFMVLGQAVTPEPLMPGFRPPAKGKK